MAVRRLLPVQRVKAKVKKGYSFWENDGKKNENGEKKIKNTQRKLQEPPVGEGTANEKKYSDKGHKCEMKSNAQRVNVSRGWAGMGEH